MNWTHVATAVLAAFLASLVEFVEALTIVLAVGTTRGWRSALTGAAAGTLLLIGLTLTLGSALQAIPLTALQLVVGILLLLFGMRWLRKAILRSIGVIGLHDETAIYAKETADLTRGGTTGVTRERLDRIAVAASFKAVTLEGLEVIFIVIATGAGGLLIPAVLGALLAGLIVIAVGILLRRPLAQVPENTLKFAVGVLLSAFGVFWIGEGLGFPWPGQDLALVGLVAGFAVASLLAAATLRRRAVTPPSGRGRAMNPIARSARELWGLFVEDASFTIGILGAVGIAAIVGPRIGLPDALRAPVLFLLVLIVLLENVARSARSARARTTD